jgi:hypothetical protein
MPGKKTRGNPRELVIGNYSLRPFRGVNLRGLNMNSRDSIHRLGLYSVSRTITTPPPTPDRTRCPVGKALQMESVVGAAREGLVLILRGSMSAGRPTHIPSCSGQNEWIGSKLSRTRPVWATGSVQPHEQVQPVSREPVAQGAVLVPAHAVGAIRALQESV